MDTSGGTTTAIRSVAGAAVAGAALGAGALAYGRFVEPNQFVMRDETLPVLPFGARPLRVLHLSDIHLVPGQSNKVRWLRELATLAPDLVVNTGDNLSHVNAVGPLLDALEPLLSFPGVFVPGSNDYYAPVRKNPFTYFTPGSRVRQEPRALPWQEMFQAFGNAGWVDLTNRNQSKVYNAMRLDFSGVDDPHLDRDIFSGFPQGSGTSPGAPHVRIGVVHAPYQRVLNEFTDAGADLILAGHTHGGQVCIPGYGALTTNCDLPTWRASGLTQWDYDGKSAPLNVSAGIGTSRFAPVRIACKPEAVLLTLTARPR